MRFLNDLSIRIKVLIPPAIFIVALVIVALLGIYGMNQQHVALSAVNEIALTKIRAVDEFITLSERVQSDVYQIFVLHSMHLPKPEIQPINARLQQGLSDLNIAYGEMLTRWQLDPTERAILDRMKPPMDAFRLQAQQAAVTVADNPSFGVLLVRSSGVSFAEFRKTLVELQDYQKAKIVRLADETEQSTRTLGSAIIVFALLITLSALGVTTQISARLISRPIRSITEVMHRLAAGDLTVGTRGLDQRDEIGGMARAVEVFRQNAIEKARLDKKLRESEEHYRLLFQHSPAGILHYDTRLRMTDCNERLAAILQSTLERLAGLDMNTLSDQSVLPALRQALAGKDGFYEGFYRSTTGAGRIWVSMRTAPILDPQGQVAGGMAVVEDISERRQAEAALQKSESLLRATGKIARVGGWEFDAATLKQAWTEEVYEIHEVGLDYEPTVSKGIDFYAPEARPIIAQAVQRAIDDGEPFTLELPFITAQGNRLWVHAIGQARQSDGKTTKVFGTFQDITARKQAEEAQARYAAELQRSNAELQQFAYVASHDLQEPLRMVTSYVQLVAKRYQGRLDADADEFIGFAVDGAHRMQRLIADLLAYSRVGTQGGALAPTDGEAVLQQAVLNLQVTLEESGAQVTHDPLPTVLADEGQLVQVFQNLIGNASKFHGDAPPRIHVSAKLLEDDAAPGGQVISAPTSDLRPLTSCEFSVRDNGLGIDPAQFERIFMVFQRLHGRGEYPGSGIGLAICKKIVERHGGRIWVESQPGQGATFYFTLPA